MNSLKKFVLFGALLCLIINVSADCGDEGEDSGWLKNLGCSIKKGAEDLGEAAKPWAEKVGNSAKEFGSNVAHKYDEIKHKLTDENVPSSTPLPALVNAPTEKVPLAPIAGEVPVSADSNVNPSNSNSETPKSIDDRFLFQPTECPAGQTKDHNGNCRPRV